MERERLVVQDDKVVNTMLTANEDKIIRETLAQLLGWQPVKFQRVRYGVGYTRWADRHGTPDTLPDWPDRGDDMLRLIGEMQARGWAVEMGTELGAKPVIYHGAFLREDQDMPVAVSVQYRTLPAAVALAAISALDDTMYQQVLGALAALRNMSHRKEYHGKA